MKSSRAVHAVLAAILFAFTFSATGAAQAPVDNSAVSTMESRSTKVSDGAESQTATATKPILIVLGVLFCGTMLVLVTGTGRESLDSINFERAYRAARETT